MSVFLVRYSVAPKEPLVKSVEHFLPYLPRSPLDIQSYQYGNSEALVFKFDAALDRVVVPSSQDIVLCHGYGDCNLETRVRNIFKQRRSFDLNAFPEAFCAIRLSSEGIEFGCSAVGIDPLFYYEDAEQIVVTNRHNLLGYWVTAPTLRKDAFAWIAGRNHIGDFGTYWNEIKKTCPGSVYGRSKNSPTYEIEINYSGMYEPIQDNEIIEYIDDVARVFEEIINSTNQNLQFWLSGGKDSRAIAGLLSNAERFKDISFSTFGERFQPDVMSATRVARELGILNSYSTQRSSMEEPTVNIAKGIARDLCSDSSGTSLADFRSIPQSPSLIIGGHESGFKTPSNTKSFEQYLESRKYWADSLGILNPESYNRINHWYTQKLTKVLEFIPRSRYPQIDAIVFRIGTYLSGSQGNAHVSRSEIHPFLDGRMVKLVLGVSDQALESQLIHYIMMRRSYASLEKIPFANDAWPKNTQFLAKKIGLSFRGEPEQAYPFRSYFPSSKVFGGYSWRIQLIERTKNFVLQYLLDNRNFFDFLNLNEIIKLFDKDLKKLHITPIYHHLSLLKICLIHQFSNGRELFDFSLEQSVENKLSELFDTSLIKSDKKIDVVDAYKIKLDSYEEALASVAERDRTNSEKDELIINARIAGKLSEILISDEALLIHELQKLKFKELPKAGIFIGCVASNVKVNISGNLIVPTQEKNKVLIAIKNISSEASVEGFSYSQAGFWFKYLNSTLEDPSFDFSLPILPENGEIWIMPWYSSSAIWYSGFSIRGN